MWGKAAQIFDQRVVIYLYCVAALYNELDVVAVKFFEDSEDFQRVAPYAVEVALLKNSILKPGATPHRSAGCQPSPGLLSFNIMKAAVTSWASWVSSGVVG